MEASTSTMTCDDWLICEYLKTKPSILRIKEEWFHLMILERMNFPFQTIYVEVPWSHSRKPPHQPWHVGSELLCNASWTFFVSCDLALVFPDCWRFPDKIPFWLLYGLYCLSVLAFPTAVLGRSDFKCHASQPLQPMFGMYKMVKTHVWSWCDNEIDIQAVDLVEFLTLTGELLV